MGLDQSLIEPALPGDMNMQGFMICCGVISLVFAVYVAFDYAGNYLFVGQ